MSFSKSTNERSITITAPEGYNLKFASFYYYDAIHAGTITADNGSYSAASYSWTPAEDSRTVKINFDASAAAVKIRKIYVGYQVAAVPPSAVEFTPATGTEQEPGTEVSLISSGATTIVYQWGSAIVGSDGDWSKATTYDIENKPTVPTYGSTNNVLSVKASNTYGYIYGAATYTIVAAKKELTLSYSGDVTLKANETLVPAVLSASDVNGDVDVDDLLANITFASSDPTIATVADDGAVTKTGKVGTTTITASFAGNSTYRTAEASYTITVQTVPVVYQEVDLTQGHTWDFSTAAAEEDNLITDTENWGLVSSTEHRYANKKALSTERLVANYEELVWTEGLYFTVSKADNVRLNMNSTPCNLQLNGSNLDITIKGLKAGQKITIEAKSASDATDRYIKAQTNITTVSGFESPGTAEYVTSVGTVTADGDIVLRSSAGINIKSITLEAAAPATVPVEITHTSGYRTYASKYITDWSSAPAGITAYKAIVTVDDVTFEAVTGKAPAGTGLLIKADAKGTYDIPTETTADDVTSALVGVTAEKTIDGAGIFVLLDGTQGVGFYRTTAESFTVGANTAYLPASVSARSFIGFDDEATGILSVNNGQLTVDGFFDLQGRRMDQPTKGLYIVNGKKVIVK